VCRRAPTGRLHPWLNGERSPVDDHTIRAGFHNMASPHPDRPRARRLRGVAFNSRWLLERWRASASALREPGLRRGGQLALWCQLHADICKRTIRQIDDPVLANVRGAGCWRMCGGPGRGGDILRWSARARCSSRTPTSPALRRSGRRVRRAVQEDQGHPPALEPAAPGERVPLTMASRTARPSSPWTASRP